MADTEAKPVLLEASQITRQYGNDVVLKGVDLTIAAGDRVAIRGPSGSGKTTLLNCLSGIDQVDTGTVHFQGQSIAGASEAALTDLRRRSFGFVFQFFHLLPTLTARENVAVPLRLNGASHRDANTRAEDLLEEVGLKDRLQALPETLSGGEMQRVAIARALVHQPALIFADEPTGNLDADTGAEILHLLDQALERHAMTLVLITHSPDAAALCPRQYQLLQGQLQHMPEPTTADVAR